MTAPTILTQRVAAWLLQNWSKSTASCRAAFPDEDPRLVTGIVLNMAIRNKYQIKQIAKGEAPTKQPQGGAKAKAQAEGEIVRQNRLPKKRQKKKARLVMPAEPTLVTHPITPKQCAPCAFALYLDEDIHGRDPSYLDGCAATEDRDFPAKAYTGNCSMQLVKKKGPASEPPAEPQKPAPMGAWVPNGNP